MLKNRYSLLGKQPKNIKKVDVYLNNKFIQTFESARKAGNFTKVPSCQNYANGSMGTHLHKKSGYSFYYKDERNK